MLSKKGIKKGIAEKNHQLEPHDFKLRLFFIMIIVLIIFIKIEYELSIYL